MATTRFERGVKLKVDVRAISLAMAAATLLCSCVAQKSVNGFDDDGINDEIVVVDCAEGIGDGIYNYLETHNDSTHATPSFVYTVTNYVGWANGWVNSYFGVETYDYTNCVRTMHVQEQNLACVNLDRLHPSIEALDLSGEVFSLSKLGICPNVRFLKLDCESAGPSLCSIVSQFPNLEALYVQGEGEYYPDTEDLLFAKRLSKLKVLVYITHSPVRRLEKSVRELFLEGRMSLLVIEAEYEYGGTEDNHENQRTISIRSNDFLEVDVAELLRSVQCNALYLQCYGVVPRGLTKEVPVKSIYLSLEMRRSR